MSDWAFVGIMVGLILNVVLLVVVVSISMIRGYQLGHRDAMAGLPSAHPWPPLPERSRNCANSRARMKRLYFGSYPISEGFSFGIDAARYDPCCSPDKCRRWAYRVGISLFFRGFEIEWTTPENRRD